MNEEIEKIIASFKAKLAELEQRLSIVEQKTVNHGDMITEQSVTSVTNNLREDECTLKVKVHERAKQLFKESSFTKDSWAAEPDYNTNNK